MEKAKMVVQHELDMYSNTAGYFDLRQQETKELLQLNGLIVPT